MFQIEIPDSGLIGAISTGETFVATITAFVIGYSPISWLMNKVLTKSFLPFVIYRVLLGTLLLIILSTGGITA
jgi:undecaprenyl-diphosphatase